MFKIVISRDEKSNENFNLCIIRNTLISSKIFITGKILYGDQFMTRLIDLLLFDI